MLAQKKEFEINPDASVRHLSEQLRMCRDAYEFHNRSARQSRQCQNEYLRDQYANDNAELAAYYLKEMGRYEAALAKKK
jgi:hypothetical protein